MSGAVNLLDGSLAVPPRLIDSCRPFSPHPCAVIVIGLTAVLLSIYRAEAQQRAHLLRCLHPRERQHAQLRRAAAGPREPAGGSGLSSGLSSGHSRGEAAGRPAGGDASGPASLPEAEEEAELSSLPTAAGRRAHAWLLAAAFAYILWSSWPSSD